MSFFSRVFNRGEERGEDEAALPLQQSWHESNDAAERARPAHHKRSSSYGSQGRDFETEELIERLRVELASESITDGKETTYDRKSRIVNKALQEIGMGSYQWRLFILCGFGWFADNLWMQGLALTLPALQTEFGVSETTVRYTTMITYIGACCGATLWGIASDIVGRRIAFNCTLFLAGLFGLAVGFGSSWFLTTLFFGGMGLGVGGNLPVDGTLFLEFIPAENQGLLTLLSIWWPVGQLVSSILAWALIPPYTCEATLQSCSLTGGQQPCCLSSQNVGWRYFNWVNGTLTLAMFFCRFFLFTLYESPKYLLSQGLQADAVGVVHSVAQYNGTTSWLTEEVLEELCHEEELSGPSGKIMDVKRALKDSFGDFSSKRIGPLFANRKLALTTSLIWLSWGTIGMAYPLFYAFLPQYLEDAGGAQGTSSADTAYRDIVITSIIGIPGSVLAYYAVDMKRFGRKGTMAISTLISGIVVFLFTLSGNSEYQTICASFSSFFSNIMYGVLYAYTPEVFPAPYRGTATGVASFINRIMGMIAPVVAAQAGKAHPAAPIYAASVLFIVSSIAMCAFPIETRGKESL